MIFRPRLAGPFRAESVGTGLSLARRALAATCACCASGVFASPSVAMPPPDLAAWSRPDSTAPLGLLLNGLGLAALATTAGVSRSIHQRLDVGMVHRPLDELVAVVVVDAGIPRMHPMAVPAGVDEECRDRAVGFFL